MHLFDRALLNGANFDVISILKKRHLWGFFEQPHKYTLPSFTIVCFILFFEPHMHGASVSEPLSLILHRMKIKPNRSSAYLTWSFKLKKLQKPRDYFPAQVQKITDCKHFSSRGSRVGQRNIVQAGGSSARPGDENKKKGTRWRPPGRGEKFVATPEAEEVLPYLRIRRYKSAAAAFPALLAPPPRPPLAKSLSPHE